MAKHLTENQLDILRELTPSASEIDRGKTWWTPLEIGGSNGSHHSSTLAALAKKGFVRFKQRGGSEPPAGENGKKMFRSRGSKSYQITEAGAMALAAHREGR